MDKQMSFNDLNDQENLNAIADALRTISDAQAAIIRANMEIKDNRKVLFDCLMAIPRTERKTFLHKYDSFEQREFICAICENAHRAMNVTPIPGWSDEIKE